MTDRRTFCQAVGGHVSPEKTASERHIKYEYDIWRRLAVRQGAVPRGQHSLTTSRRLRGNCIGCLQSTGTDYAVGHWVDKHNGPVNYVTPAGSTGVALAAQRSSSAEALHRTGRPPG